ncbi:MAG TPA: hypothetical protein VEU47_02670 [Candidatus Cybelea sp.]|nr:hypothetical protein [Candidatus Cybelea sp.]
MRVDTDSETTVDEVADGIYRISTPVRNSPGGFSFNQYLIVDDEPLLFHTGLRHQFSVVRAAVQALIPVETLRHISFSHYEADECGSLNEFLSVAPKAAPLCGEIAAMVNIRDMADRAPRVAKEGEAITLGKRRVRWIATPHMPHAWECGLLFEETTRTLFCSDLFTQPGATHPPVTEGDILGPSESFRARFDYFSHTKNVAPMIEKVAAAKPATLACMHGSAWRGDGAKLLRELGARLAGSA